MHNEKTMKHIAIEDWQCFVEILLLNFTLKLEVTSPGKFSKNCVSEITFRFNMGERHLQLENCSFFPEVTIYRKYIGPTLKILFFDLK